MTLTGDGTIGGALPVTFSSFQAERLTESITLNWSTASEKNNKGFEIEQSLDGEHFEQIGFVPGLGTSDGEQEYQFDIWNAEAAYYRFRQIDFDGQFSYSPTRFVAALEVENTRPQLSPNPVSGNITISNIPDGEHLMVEIFDLQGRQLAILNGTKAEVEARLSQQFDQVPAGIYLVNMRTRGRSFNQKVVKE